MPLEDRDETTDRSTKGDEALLQEIRDRYRYAVDAWEEVRRERQVDMRYICGDPWDPDEKKARKDANRPAISHDELNQYINQGVNGLRQNKRGIKVEPRGNGANDKTAELRQDLIRTIEYRSKAQSVYCRAGQDMYEGSYGFFRVSRKYVANESDEQEIVLKPIPNPDSVLYDPDCKEADWSDAEFVFVVEPISKEEFKRRWPAAEKTDFSAEDLRIAKDWIQDRQVLLAEYWKIVTTRVKGKTKSGRMIDQKRVVQYLTNGIEILEENEQPGTEIPIPAMIGLERYLDEGSGPKRKLFSLARLAREPQMSLAYLVSQEMEEAGMTPKVPVMGYVGQFDSDADTWETLNKVPHAYVQVDPVPDPANPNQVLPLPQWRQFTPNFQEYEVAKDSCRRAIQAAMGISGLPTAAQRDSEKSGIALERISTSEAIGSFHFTEGFDRGIERAGRIVDSWIPVVYDTEKEIGLQRANDTRRVVRINTQEPYVNQSTGKPEHYPIGDEEHDVTVSTGPSFQSQRQAVSDFLDNLIENLPKLPVPPPSAAKLLALAIQMKELGPKGDEMAEIINPTQPDQSGQLQNMQAQAQQQSQVLQAMQAELQKLQLERAGKVVDNEYRLQLERMREENALAIAEVNTKAQALSERLETFSDMMSQFHTQAHEAGMQAQDQAHQATQAQQAQTAQQQQQQQVQATQQGAPPEAAPSGPQVQQ
jgi:hypothetical protein